MSLVDHLPTHLTVSPLLRDLDSRFTLEDDSLLAQVADAPALTPQDWGVKLYLLGQLQISGIDSETGIRSLQKSIDYLMACQALDCAARVALFLGRIFLETGRIDDAEQALEIIVGLESTTATWKELKTQIDFLMARIKYERGKCPL